MTKNEVEKFKNLITKKYIIDLLTDYHKNQLEGKGFDFYFALSSDLEKLNKRY